MPCSKRGQSGDLEYKKIIASPAGKVNRNSPTKNALGKFSSDGIFPPRQHFGSVRRRETPARCRAQAFGRSPTGASRPGPPPPLWGRRERAFGAWAAPEFTAFSELRKNKSSGQKNSPRHIFSGAALWANQPWFFRDTMAPMMSTTMETTTNTM